MDCRSWLLARVGARIYAVFVQINASIAWDYLADCVLVAHRPGRMVDADFGEFLEDVLARPEVRRVVVRAADGAPRADHRAELQRWYKRNSVRGAVLTTSLLARGGVTALSWFGVTIHAFEPHRLDDAFEYVQIEREHWPTARARMLELIQALIQPPQLAAG